MRLPDLDLREARRAAFVAVTERGGRMSTTIMSAKCTRELCQDAMVEEMRSGGKGGGEGTTTVAVNRSRLVARARGVASAGIPTTRRPCRSTVAAVRIIPPVIRRGGRRSSRSGAVRGIRRGSVS